MDTRRRLFVRSSLCSATALLLQACGGGGEDPAPTPPAVAQPQAPAAALQVRLYGDGTRNVVRGSGPWRAESIGSNGVLEESVVATPQGTHRVYYGADGRVTAVQTAAGDVVRMEYPRDGRVDVTATDAGGNRRWAIALYVDGDRLLAAPMGSDLGTQQITARLSGALVGALTVSRDPGDPLAGVDTARAVALPANLVAVLGAQALEAPRATAQAAGQAVPLATPGQQMAAGLLQAGVLGTTLVYAGLSLPTILAGTAAAGLLATVGSVALVGAGAYAVARGISSIRNGAARALMGETMDEVGDAGTSERSLLDRLQRAIDAIVSTGRAGSEPALTVDAANGAAADVLAPPRGLASLPAAVGALAEVGSRVRGVIVDTAGRLFSGRGTLAADGTLGLDLATATGTAVRVDGQLTSGSLSGRYVAGAAQGSVAGQREAVGACNATSSSGGEGTFSYAYNVGSANGSVPFSYQMYSIPDQARVVDIAGNSLFDTGGLVSGSRSTTLTLQGESNLVVLINAPNNGTAWDFVLGCGR